MQDFSKQRRLLDKKQYARVFEQATKVVMPGFLLLTRKNDHSTARLGLAISKKQVAKAVNRNRIKRLFRESFRLTSLENIDVIALARTNLVSMSNQEISAKLEKAWKKLNHIYGR